MTGLRVGIASQTPFVRPKRTLEELARDKGPLGDPVPLDALVRGVDYSVTPGGVARMIASVAPLLARSGHLASGEWVALATGFPRDLELGPLRLLGAELPEANREGYGRFKEIVWEALNGLPPRLDAPLAATGADAGALADFVAWSHASASVLRERHRARRFDVLYLNDWQLLPAGPLLRGTPRVLHYHAPFAAWTPPGWREWVLAHMREFDAIIVSTPEYRSELERAGLERPVHVVAPWLDPADYEQPGAADARSFAERFGIADDDEVVLNVGRMDPVKGQDRLIRAMPRLLALRPRARLVLVGNGSFSSSKRAGIGLSKGKRWRASLETLARELGVEERVTFTGHVPHVDAMRAFARCDAFAFPSVAEGFGLAVVEAWLYEKPVVVDPRAGVSSLVRDGGNGLVVDCRDASALALALARTLADRDAAARMGEAGRVTAAVADVNETAPRLAEILEAYAERREPVLPPEAAP